MTWLTGWNRRKQITVNGSTYGALSDYQMKLTVNQASGTDPGIIYCGGNIKSDFSDLRFTDSGGSTELYYWIESIAGTSPSQNVTVWVKIGSIPTIGTTIYVYYNNPSPSDSYGTNGNNTFDFFDDFSASSIDPTKWSTASGTWTESGGTLNITVTGSSDDRFLLSTSTYKFKNCSIRTRFKASYGGIKLISRTASINYCNSYNNPDPGYVSSASSESSDVSISRNSGCTGHTIFSATQTVSVNSWHIFETSLYENFFKANLDDGVYVNSGTDSSPVLVTERHGLHCRSPAGSATYNFDFYAVRKFVNPEPTFSATILGTEELGIIAYSMSLHPSETPCRTGICTIRADITWQNLGSSSITFRPKILIDGITEVQAASDTTIIGPYPATSSLIQITTPTLLAGTHSICPYPN